MILVEFQLILECKGISFFSRKRKQSIKRYAVYYRMHTHPKLRNRVINRVESVPENFYVRKKTRVRIYVT